MKRSIIILCYLCIAGALSAQSANADTLMGLPDWMVVFDNYQVCGHFQTCPEEYLDRNYFQLDFYAGRGDSSEMLLTQAFTGRRLAVKGVAVMALTDLADVNSRHRQVYYYDDSCVEEKVMILNADTLPIASATWFNKIIANEVAVPQCTQTMADGDSSKFLHFGIAELRFNRSVAVDSTFFIGGTLRNNVTTVDSYGRERFLHKPTLYPYVAERHPDPCASCGYEPGHHVGTATPGSEWQRLDAGKMWSGPFFLILDVDRYRLTALSGNDTMGSVSGSGVYNPLDTAVVEATPSDGFRFVCWNDGITDNPRAVEVLCDTTLVAFFGNAGDTTAIDGAPTLGPVFSLYPNPAREELLVTTDEEGQLQLRLFDVSGRILMQRTFSRQAGLDVSRLTAGQYYLMVTGSEGTRVEPFVKR